MGKEEEREKGEREELAFLNLQVGDFVLEELKQKQKEGKIQIQFIMMK